MGAKLSLPRSRFCLVTQRSSSRVTRQKRLQRRLRRALIIGHYRVPPSLCKRNEVKYSKWFFILMHIKLIFTSLRSRRLEVVGTRKNGRARRRHASLPRACARSLFRPRPLLPSACYASYIFTRKVVHLASFWKWGLLELGSGLLTQISPKK